MTANGSSCSDSVDNAGNIGPSASARVHIDTSRPRVSAPLRATAKRGSVAILHYRVADAIPNEGRATVRIRITTAKGKLVRSLKPVIVRVNRSMTARFRVPRSWRSSSYRFVVYATDKAGNRQIKPAVNRLIVK